jgi:hypothetical protein
MELRELDLNLLVVFHEVFRERQISGAAMPTCRPAPKARPARWRKRRRPSRN